MKLGDLVPSVTWMCQFRAVGRSENTGGGICTPMIEIRLTYQPKSWGGTISSSMSLQFRRSWIDDVTTIKRLFLSNKGKAQNSLKYHTWPDPYLHVCTGTLWWTIQLNLYETDLLFRYLSHDLTWHCSSIYEKLHRFAQIWAQNCFCYCCSETITNKILSSYLWKICANLHDLWCQMMA